MRNLLVFMLLFPQLVYANIPESVVSTKDSVVYDGGKYYLIHPYTIITNEEVCFKVTKDDICLPKKN